MEKYNNNPYSEQLPENSNLEDTMRRASVKNSKEDSKTLQDLKWTLFQDSQREEAKKISSQSIMSLYQSPHATPEQKQWCRDMMVVKYERYLYQMIHTYFESFLPKHITEFFQYAVVGLLTAMNANYDVNSGYEFYTYMNGFVKRELSAYAAHLMYGQSAHYANVYKKVLRAQNDLMAAGIEPTCSMIALSAGLTESAVMKCLDLQKRTDFVYIDGMDDPNNLSESYDTPAIAYEKKEREAEIHEAVNKLPEIRRKIIKMRFGITTCKQDEIFVRDKGMNIRMIADEMGMTPAKVKVELEASLAELKLMEPFRESYEHRYEKVRKTINRMDTDQPSAEDIRKEMRLTAQAVEDDMDLSIEITASGNIEDLSVQFDLI